MKCFIASAFKKDDVDQIYDVCVLPTLKALAIKPLRVDRVEHNDDIDDKIIELMNQADFAIVDLTYARPSAYYEAGHITGSGKPVIYIARGDHFRARDHDPDDLLRVHFDLQMKNIVAWSSPNDAFSIRLKKRLKHVLKPLLKKRDLDEKRRTERMEFAKLPVTTRVNNLVDKADSLLKSKGFKLEESYKEREGSAGKGLIASKDTKTLSKQVVVYATPSALKTVFQQINKSVYLGGPLGPNDQGVPIEVHYFISSLRKIPGSRLATLETYSSLSNTTMHRQYGTKDVFVHVISGIGTMTGYEESLRSLFEHYGL